MTPQTKLTLHLTRILVVSNLAVLRRARIALKSDLEVLQDSMRERGSDVITQSALLAVANEIELVRELIEEMRAVLGIQNDVGVDNNEE